MEAEAFGTVCADQTGRRLPAGSRSQYQKDGHDIAAAHEDQSGPETRDFSGIKVRHELGLMKRFPQRFSIGEGHQWLKIRLIAARMINRIRDEGLTAARWWSLDFEPRWPGDVVGFGAGCFWPHRRSIFPANLTQR